MHPGFTVSRASISFRGKAIPGAEDRQKKIPGFDQGVFSKSKVLCVGAGGMLIEEPMRHPNVPESLDSWSILHRMFRFDRRRWDALDRSRRNE